MQARASAREHARTFAGRSRTQPGLPTVANPDRARVTGISRDDFPKAAVFVLASSADDPAVIETARAHETAMKERGGAVEAKHFSTGGHIVLVQSETQPEAIRTSVDFLRKYLTS